MERQKKTVRWTETYTNRERRCQTQRQEKKSERKYREIQRAEDRQMLTDRQADRQNRT